MTVTKGMLDALRAERARPQARLAYTIGGSVEVAVAKQEAERRGRAIAAGEASLRKSLEEFRTQQTFSSRHGLAKAHFNHSR